MDCPKKFLSRIHPYEVLILTWKKFSKNSAMWFHSSKTKRLDKTHELLKSSFRISMHFLTQKFCTLCFPERKTGDNTSWFSFEVVLFLLFEKQNKPLYQSSSPSTHSLDLANWYVILCILPR